MFAPRRRVDETGEACAWDDGAGDARMSDNGAGEAPRSVSRGRPGSADGDGSVGSSVSRRDGAGENRGSALPGQRPQAGSAGGHSSGAVASSRRESARTGASDAGAPSSSADADDAGSAWSPWRGTQAGLPRFGSASSDTSPRFPSLNLPGSGTTGATTPPPPRASARFPDAPPTAGREGRRDSGGSPRGDSAGQRRTGGVPSAPVSRPGTPRRTGAPAETAEETTFRLRPVPAQNPSESDGRPASASGTAGAPPKPAARPGTTTTGPAPRGGTAGSPSQPGSRPGASGSADRAYPGNRTNQAPRTTYATPGTPANTADISAPTRLSPDPALSWSAPMTPGGTLGATRPVVSFGQPEGYDEQARPRPLGGRLRGRTAAAAACVVLGLGLIGGAATGSWLVGDPGDGGGQDAFATAGSLWHSVPVDQLFPPTVDGQGAGPGGADRTWTRVAVAPDTGCANAFDALLRKALAPVGCQRLLRATYTDATQSYVTTVGLLFTKADSAAMGSLHSRFVTEGLGRRTDLMPRPYAAEDTVAAAFGPQQRASWTISVLTDAPAVVYAVSGWADGRTVDAPEPAEKAMQAGATTPVAQAGLGHEAQGLADRIERALRRHVRSATEQPS